MLPFGGAVNLWLQWAGSLVHRSAMATRLDKMEPGSPITLLCGRTTPPADATWGSIEVGVPGVTGLACSRCSKMNTEESVRRALSARELQTPEV